MLATIKLHGEISHVFGETWRLDVNTPAEAVKAIDVNQPGFAKYIVDLSEKGVHHQIIVGERVLEEEVEAFGPFSKTEEIHIVPVIGGAKSKGAMILFGIALLVIAPMLPVNPLFGIQSLTMQGIAANIGIGLILGGIAQMLVKAPPAPTQQDSPEQKQSKYFSGPTPGGKQGDAVPVGYGTAILGGTPVSAGFTTENIL